MIRRTYVSWVTNFFKYETDIFITVLRIAHVNMMHAVYIKITKRISRWKWRVITIAIIMLSIRSYLCIYTLHVLLKLYWWLSWWFVLYINYNVWRPLLRIIFAGYSVSKTYYYCFTLSLRSIRFIGVDDTYIIIIIFCI